MDGLKVFWSRTKWISYFIQQSSRQKKIPHLSETGSEHTTSKILASSHFITSSPRLVQPCNSSRLNLTGVTELTALAPLLFELDIGTTGFLPSIICTNLLTPSLWAWQPLRHSVSNRGQAQVQPCPEALDPPAPGWGCCAGGMFNPVNESSSGGAKALNKGSKAVPPTFKVFNPGISVNNWLHVIIIPPGP